MFYIIKFTYFGTEYMDNNISGIHNDPVTLRQPFCVYAFNIVFVEFFLKLSGQTAYMSGRITGSYNQIVGQSGIIC